MCILIYKTPTAQTIFKKNASYFKVNKNKKDNWANVDF